MRKELGLIALGAVAFDLGTIVVPAQAADTTFIKIGELSNELNFAKIKMDDVSAMNACLSHKGTLVEFKGDKYCQTPKSPGATAAPSTQRK